jgi:hypothetical protein
MTNLSPVTRLVGLCAAGAGAALFGLAATPVAHADADAAYGDLSTIYGDVIVAVNSYGPFEDLVFDSNLASLGNIISDSGIYVGDPFSSGATAATDVATILSEGTTLAGQLTNLEQTIAGEPAGNATIDNPEYPITGDTLAFQDQINTDIANLPTITSQDETNPLVIADLSALYGNEINFSNELVNLGEQLANASPSGISDVNANILSEGLGIAIDTQSTADTLTLLADLSSIGL